MLSNRLTTPSSTTSFKPILPMLRRPNPHRIRPNVNSNTFTNDLPSDNDIKSLFDTLNKQANIDYKNYIRTTLSQWKPIKKYATSIATLNNRELELLFVIYRRYVPPLENFEKLLIRPQLLHFFNQAKTDDERRFYHSILDYYELIEDI